MSRRESLLASLRSATTERERAELENAIHDDAILTRTLPQMPGRQGKVWSSGHVIREITGEGGDAMLNRRSLWLAGPWTEVLWQRVDHQQMPLRTAVRLMRAAREAHKAGTPLPIALQKLLEEHERLPLRRVFTKKGIRLTRVRPQKVAAPAPEPPPTPEELEGNFWRKVRGLVRAQIDEVIAEADAPRRDEIRREFEAELDGLLKRLQSRVRGEHNGLATPSRVRGSELAAACELLSLDVPARGQAVDEHLANRRRRSALKVLHPDRVGPGREKEFQAVNDAYELVLRYNAQVRTRHELTAGNVQ